MDVRFNELEPAAFLVIIEHFINPIHDLALTNRSAHMRAIAFPGEKLITQSKHTDLQIAFCDDTSFAVGNLVNIRDKNLCQVYPLTENGKRRSSAVF